MKHSLLLTIFSLVISAAWAQEKPAYKIYNGQGKEVKYSKMIKEIQVADVLLFGELHNNAIAHWLELEVSKDLLIKRGLVLGAEMLEADNQTALDDYLKGTIEDRGFDSLARLWPNYDTDYKPLVDFAKENQLVFVASNIPRRYASLVYKGGFEALDTISEKEKSWMAPLPIDFDPEIETYKEILTMMGDHGSPRLVMAQAIKDATMAHFILENLTDGSLFIHYNGAYHSDNYEGILWHMKRKKAEINCKTISTVSQDNINVLQEENFGKADFIICVDADMTNTY
ncbi:MAG: ChaN family lipoprotein [Vicingaceae bacterium]